MPSLSISLRSSTSTSRSNCLPIFLACWPSHVGVQTLPGRLPNSRAIVTPAATADPWRTPCCTGLASPRWQKSVIDVGIQPGVALGLVWVYR